MTFEKLRAVAVEMSAEERDATLVQLAKDPRFAAVLRVVLDEKENVADSACALKFADNHGCLAHAAGARYAWLELEGRIRTACEARVKRKGSREVREGGEE